MFPGDESKPTGASEHQTALALNGGAALGGKIVRYAITGANPGSGAITTDSAGNADISWTGQNAGRDTLTAFLDTNGDGVKEDAEAGDLTTLTWTSPAANPPPGTTPQPPALAATLKATAAKLQHALLTHKIVVFGQCDKACTITGIGHVTVPAAARVFRLPAVHRTLRSAGGAKLTFSLSKKVRKAISAALRRHKRVTAKITLVAKTGSLTSRPRGITVRLVR